MKPVSPPPELKRAIASRIADERVGANSQSPSATPFRMHIGWVVAAAGIAAAMALAVLLNLPDVAPVEPPSNVVADGGATPRVQPEVAVPAEPLPPPTALAYRMAALESDEALDALLQQHAAVTLVSSTPPVAASRLPGTEMFP